MKTSAEGARSGYRCNWVAFLSVKLKKAQGMRALREISLPHLRSFLLILLLLSLKWQASAQDWVRTGTNLGAPRIRLAAADFNPSSTDPQTPALKTTFDTTLYSDLNNAGIFDMVSKLSLIHI